MSVAVIAHGAGSSADFVRRVFGRGLQAAGYELVTWDDHSGDVDIVTEHIGRLVDSTDARMVGGVSLGAHAAARYAAGRSLDGVLCVLPGWMGAPNGAAALGAASAVAVARDGVLGALARLVEPGWVGEELTRAWATYPASELVTALATASASAGPAAATLRRVTAPVGIVAMTDDPFHPLAVARDWREQLPVANLRTMGLGDAAADRAAIGDEAVRAWLSAKESRRRSVGAAS